jgi:hypothetical protein
VLRCSQAPGEVRRKWLQISTIIRVNIAASKWIGVKPWTLGVVSEVVPRAKLVNRAWELARQIVTRPSLAVRYARIAMTQQLKQLILENPVYGLALEGLGAVQSWPGARTED